MAIVWAVIVNVNKHTDITKVDVASKAGYLLGLSRDGKWSYKTDGAYKLSRVYIGPKHTEANFEDRINNSNYQ